MSRLTDRITGINGVAPGGVATAELPTSPRRYHSLTLHYKTNANQATIEADILFIRLAVNGVQQREFTAAELIAENAANGIPFVAGEIFIPFSEPKRATVMEEQATSWDLDGQSSFTLSVVIAGTAVAPTLNGYAEFDHIRNDGNKEQGRTGANIIRWVRNTIVCAAAGDFDVKTLPKGIVQRMTIYGPVSAPTAVKVMQGSKTVHDLTRAEITSRLSRYGITQPANALAIWYDYTQQIVDALPVLPGDDYNVKLTAADAQNFTVLTQVRVPGFMVNNV